LTRWFGPRDPPDVRHRVGQDLAAASGEAQESGPDAAAPRRRAGCALRITEHFDLIVGTSAESIDRFD
jgi:hypothetical protein